MHQSSSLLISISPPPRSSGSTTTKLSPKTLGFHRQCFQRRIRGLVGAVVTTTMRDRSKNRRPLQRGRNLSIEAIQTVQALKRAASTTNGHDDLERVVEAKLRRLIKLDMMAVLCELQRQNQALLALLVFEEIRREYWYKPRLSVYVDLVTVLASNGLSEQVELICSYLKLEKLEADTEGFNSLLRVLLDFGFVQTAMDCFRLMKLWESEPDESTFRILINGLESKGEMDISVTVRQEAMIYFGTTLDFLEDEETVTKQ